MITKFKIYENQKEPKEGDYVIIKLGIYPHLGGEILDDFDLIEKIENSIGYINYIDPNDGYTKYSLTILDCDDKRLEDNDLWIDREEIIHFSDNKDDLEMMIQSKKYNL